LFDWSIRAEARKMTERTRTFLCDEVEPILHGAAYYRPMRTSRTYQKQPPLLPVSGCLFFYEDAGYNEEIAVAETYGGCGHKSTKESAYNH